MPLVAIPTLICGECSPRHPLVAAGCMCVPNGTERLLPQTGMPTPLIFALEDDRFVLVDHCASTSRSNRCAEHFVPAFIDAGTRNLSHSPSTSPEDDSQCQHVPQQRMSLSVVCGSGICLSKLDQLFLHFADLIVDQVNFLLCVSTMTPEPAQLNPQLQDVCGGFRCGRLVFHIGLQWVGAISVRARISSDTTLMPRRRGGSSVGRQWTNQPE